MRKPPDDLLEFTTNGGVPRERILDALRDRRLVRQAIQVGRCLHCRDGEVDVTGLCLICRSFLNDEERVAAQVYYDGP